MHIGEYYKMWMKANKYTNAFVSKETGVHRSTLSNFLNGIRVINTGDLLKLTRFAGMTVEGLYDTAKNVKRKEVKKKDES